MVVIDPGTGAIRLHRYLVVEDCGVVINPMVVDGQVRGGVTQGVAAALLERVCFDLEGQPVSTTLMDYLAPTAAELNGDFSSLLGSLDEAPAFRGAAGLSLGPKTPFFGPEDDLPNNGGGDIEPSAGRFNVT